LTITEAIDGGYSVEITGSHSSSLSPGEAKAARHLFPPGRRSIALQKSSPKHVGAAVKALRTFVFFRRAPLHLNGKALRLQRIVKRLGLHLNKAIREESLWKRKY
jgi:hypothetical protein